MQRRLLHRLPCLRPHEGRCPLRDVPLRLPHRPDSTDARRATGGNSNGKLIATSSSDRTIRLWDAASSAELLKLSREGVVRVVLFFPDGKQLASGGDDKAVKLWDVTSLSK